MPNLNTLYTTMNAEEEFRDDFMELVKAILKSFCKKPLRASFQPGDSSRRQITEAPIVISGIKK